MQNITSIYNEFVEKELLPVDWKQQLYNKLGCFKPDELKTIEEHRMFVEALHKLRQYNSEDMKLNGKKFLDTIVSLLAVGEDGVYSSNLRFMYELIQNVDDCDYKDKENCHLDIQFITEPAPGKIVFTYNENGFSPFNVFSITGIAEESKNISADKIEIGEKGIGFKSVFGVAEKVHIESGMFSFELNKENFTVPIAKYEGYKPVDGTRLTVYLDWEHDAKTIHKELIEQYGEQNAILNKNPILFLNKLTHLKINDNLDQFVEFDVEKSKLDSENKASYEENVAISVRMKFIQFGRAQMSNKEIFCRRYSMPVTYGEVECKSRYGNDAGFKERKHKIVAVFPKLDDSMKNYEGVMYSFLPTQIKVAAPLVLHVPYKLDGSREFVDPQGSNAWFKHTNEVLGTFLKNCYRHMAREIMEGIVSYLPRRYAPLFRQDNEKVKCLNLDMLKAQALYDEDIFYCTDGTFNNGKTIVSFEKNDSSKREDHIKIYELLNEQAKLFIPKDETIDMKWFGVKIISDVNRRLFLAGIRDEKIFEKVIEILESSEDEIHYYQLLAGMDRFKISPLQVQVIAKYKRLISGFDSLFQTRLNDGELPPYELAYADRANSELSTEIKKLVEATELSKKFEAYLKEISYRVVTIDVEKEEFAFPAKNVVILSKKAPLGSFGVLSSEYDPRHTFSATLKILQASNRLNNASDDMSNAEYLKLLRDVRLSLVNAFGKKAYASYINIVNKAGADNNRFLGELLQNADDCQYDSNVVPEFSLKVSGTQLIAEYNEKGFTKDNVRAITAIGESTKKLLLNGEDKAIGEKGIGFKSVFGIAKSVEIHSNGFDFKLLGERPTIPEKCTPVITDGTQMVYELKDASIRSVFSKDKILRQCLCLRNLKRIDINGTFIRITDEDDKRIISVDEKEYVFEKFIYDFEILDSDAIEERESDHKVVSKEQYIVYYIPPKGLKLDIINLYTGLPVSQVECQIPLIIDAPFELTTSRDDVLQGKWNEYVRNAIYEGVLELIDNKKDDMGIDVLKLVKYQNNNGTISVGTFNNSFLNSISWVNHLKNMEILPCLTDDEYIEPGRNACIVPDIIAEVAYADESDAPFDFSGTLIDVRHKSQYLPLLEYLDCEYIELDEIIDFIAEKIDGFLGNGKRREELYKYLASVSDDIEDEDLEEKVHELPIFPIRTTSGTDYVTYEGNIYTHPSQTSNEDFLILDTDVLSFEICQSILGSYYRINELTQEVYDARYRKNLEEMIQASDKTNEEKAKFLLREFKLNKQNLDKCKYTLKGLLNEIPMEMANGSFEKGNKFINGQGLILNGEMVQNLYVSEKYTELAKYLGCTDVLKIHYSDIDVSMDEISDEEIQDIQDNFDNYIDILSGLINDGIISDEQIEKFDLQYLAYGANSDRQGGVVDENDDYEDFPGKSVADINRLRAHIKYQFEHNPNPYVKKRRIVREPLHEVEKKNYTNSMYRSEYDDKKCFCQMCGRKVYEAYIERNDVQVRPKYGWEQMYLSLCPTCSKDYIFLRNNKNIWNEFVSEIFDTDIDEDDETIDVSIGERTITFTATHLAEIQEIMELESRDDRVFEEDETVDAEEDNISKEEKILKKPSADGGEENYDESDDYIDQDENSGDDELEEADEDFEADDQDVYNQLNYSDEEPYFDDDFILIEKDHIYLTMLDTRVFEANDGTEYLVVTMALKNGIHSSLKLTARMIEVNDYDISDEEMVSIPEINKLEQVVFFAVPFGEIPVIEEGNRIWKVSFWIEADYITKGAKHHAESERVICDSDGIAIEDDSEDSDSNTEEDEKENGHYEEHDAGQSSTCFSDYIEATEECSSCHSPMELVRGKSGKCFMKCSSCGKTALVDPNIVNFYIQQHKIKCPVHGCNIEARVNQYGIYLLCDVKGHFMKIDEI